MTKSCVVVGGGFKGMIAAYLLQEKGIKVTLLERGHFLGGIMFSGRWDNFFVDNGVHLFDSVPKNLGEIISDVMDGDVVPIDFNYASVYNEVTTPGLAIPDLVNISSDVQKQILFEVLECLTHEVSEHPISAFQKMSEMYGATATGLLSDSMKHIYGISAQEVEADALRQTAYHRLKFLPDALALELKKHPVLADRIAAKRVVVGKVDDFVSLYPGHGGMGGFCQKMHMRLEAMGVEVMLGKGVARLNVESGHGAQIILDEGSKLDAETVFWGNDHTLLAKVWNHDESLDLKTHKTPMILFYFKVPANHINNYTYFHQFTPEKYVFRSAAAGLYSQQEDDRGHSFISVECPVEIGSDFWISPEAHQDKVWQECVDMGLLKQDAFSIGKPKVVKAPVTHRFPKKGYFSLCGALEKQVRDSQNVITLPKKEAFTRREIMWSVEEAIEGIA